MKNVAAPFLSVAGSLSAKRGAIAGLARCRSTTSLAIRVIPSVPPSRS
jgi:hypothetical protein